MVGPMRGRVPRDSPCWSPFGTGHRPPVIYHRHRARPPAAHPTIESCGSFVLSYPSRDFFVRIPILVAVMGGSLCIPLQRGDAQEPSSPRRAAARPAQGPAVTRAQTAPPKALTPVEQRIRAVETGLLPSIR